MISAESRVMLVGILERFGMPKKMAMYRAGLAAKWLTDACLLPVKVLRPDQCREVQNLWNYAFPSFQDENLPWVNRLEVRSSLREHIQQVWCW